MDMVEREARRALARLQRGVDKTRRELVALRGALETVEGEDFPQAEYDEIEQHLNAAGEFTAREGRRLQAKILMAGGLEPGRVRRSSGR